MAGFDDPLSFGEQDKDLADLADLSLDTALLDGDGPLLTAAAPPATQQQQQQQQPGSSSDPFASLAAEAAPPTYGQLVTPQSAAAPGSSSDAPPPLFSAGGGAAAAPNPLLDSSSSIPAAAAAAAGAAAAAAAATATSSSQHAPLLGGASGGPLQQEQQHHLPQPVAAAAGGGGGGDAGASSSSSAALQQQQWQQQQQQHGAPAADGGSPRLVLPPRLGGQQQLPLEVVVSDPVKREAPGMLPGMRAWHVDYLVTTRSHLPGWSAPEVAVRRRFRDVVALSDLLKAKFRGFFIPPRPEKNAVEGQRCSDGFVEERRLGLQKYLARLAVHPLIGASEELRVFLEAPGDLSTNHRWAGLAPPAASLIEGTAKFSMQLLGRESKVVDPVAAAQPAARSKDLMRAMKEAAQGMRGGREVPLDELDLRRLREGAEGMREQLAGTSKAAERLVSRLDGLGATAGDLGMALFKVAKFEEAEGGALATFTGTLRHSAALIADEKRTAAALVRASKMLSKVTGRTAQELGTLHDTLAAMPAAVRGYMSREHQMLTWHTLEGDLEAKHKALAEADKSKVRRVDELRGDVARLELSIAAAKAEYDKLKAANLSETARFAAERRAEYGAMLHAFAATQVAASERLAEVWLQLAGELGAAPEELSAVRVVPDGGGGQQQQQPLFV